MGDLRWLSDRRRLLRRVYAESPAPDWTGDRWLRPGEVAALMQVSRRTVSEWALNGKLESIMTPGGHRRFRSEAVRALLDSLRVDATAATPKGRGRGPSE